MTPPRTPGPDHAAPFPLVMAVATAGLEALAYLGVGAVELFQTDSRRPEVGITAGLFFLVLAGFLALCAWRVWRLETWARAPVVMVQLIQIPVGISFWGGRTTWVALCLFAASGAVLAGIFHPRSLAALERAD